MPDLLVVIAKLGYNLSKLIVPVLFVLSVFGLELRTLLFDLLLVFRIMRVETAIPGTLLLELFVLDVVSRVEAELIVLAESSAFSLLTTVAIKVGPGLRFTQSISHRAYNKFPDRVNFALVIRDVLYERVHFALKGTRSVALPEVK